MGASLAWFLHFDTLLGFVERCSLLELLVELAFVECQLTNGIVWFQIALEREPRRPSVSFNTSHSTRTPMGFFVAQSSRSSLVFVSTTCASTLTFAWIVSN